MDTEVNYVGFTRRTIAEVLDQIIFFLPLLIFALISLGKDGFRQALEQPGSLLEEFVGMILFLVPYIALKILMITRLGGTPGKLLCGMRIKDANIFTNVTLMQATIRCISKEGIWIICNFLPGLLPDYVSTCLLIVLILVLIFAIFDQRKQTFYDKIAKTVVINYKPS